MEGLEKAGWLTSQCLSASLRPSPACPHAPGTQASNRSLGNLSCPPGVLQVGMSLSWALPHIPYMVARVSGT